MSSSMKDRLIRKFEDEIQTLDRELKIELPKEIKRARELGDLRENAEYSSPRLRSSTSTAFPRIAPVSDRRFM
jgi:transcription elongation factor GreA